jgi:hypothetical protein
MTIEIWKEVLGYEGIYQVSNIGRIKNMPRKFVPFERIRKNCLDSDGYGLIILYYEGTAKTKKVHRLVAQAFIPNPLNLPEVNHKNGVKTDNRVENLEWVTKKQNNEHAIRMGLITPKGSQNYNAKLNDESVTKIKKLISDGVSNKEIAKIFGMSNQMISNIKLGYNWSNI